MRGPFYYLLLFLFSTAVTAQTDTTAPKLKLKENTESSIPSGDNSYEEYHRGVCVSMNYIPKNTIGNQSNSLPTYIGRPDTIYGFGEIEFGLRPPFQPFVGYYIKQGGNYQFLEFSFFSAKRDFKKLYGETKISPFSVYALRYTFNFIANKNTKLNFYYNLAGMASVTGSNIKYSELSEDATGITYSNWELKSNGLLVQLSPNLFFIFDRINFTLSANFNLFTVTNENFNLHQYYESSPPFTNPAYFDIKKVDNKKTYFRWVTDYAEAKTFFHSYAIRIGYSF